MYLSTLFINSLPHYLYGLYESKLVRFWYIYAYELMGL